MIIAIVRVRFPPRVQSEKATHACRFLFLEIAKHRFPKNVTPEFLLVDLVSNLDKLAEDAEFVLKNVSAKVKTMNLKKLKHAVKEFGSVRAKSFLTPLIKMSETQHAH